MAGCGLCDGCACRMPCDTVFNTARLHLFSVDDMAVTRTAAGREPCDAVHTYEQRQTASCIVNCYEMRSGEVSRKSSTGQRISTSHNALMPPTLSRSHGASSHLRNLHTYRHKSTHCRNRLALSRRLLLAQS